MRRFQQFIANALHVRAYLAGKIIRDNVFHNLGSIRKSGEFTDDDAAYQAAVRKISFGRERESLGYSDFEIQVVKRGETVADGTPLKDVPTLVKISAKRPEE